MVMLTAELCTFTTLKTCTPVICVICKMTIEPYGATAGSLYADGRQAFACTAHLYSHNRRSWIVCWTAFDIEQRLIRKQQKAAQ